MYTDPVQLLRGLRQGRPLSPFLFNIFINDLPLGTEETGVVVPTGKGKTWRQSTIKIGCKDLAAVNDKDRMHSLRQ
jgi:hypothetical protein